MSSTTTTIKYNIPIAIEWFCSACGKHNQVLQSVSIEGEASTKRLFNDDTQNRAELYAKDRLDRWILTLQNAGKTQAYYGTELVCACSNCTYKEAWVTKYKVAEKIILKFAPLILLAFFLGIYLLIEKDIITGICCMVPFALICLIEFIFFKSNQRNNNILTKRTALQSLPIVYYKGRVISCPESMRDKYIHVSASEVSSDMHNISTSESDGTAANRNAPIKNNTSLDRREYNASTSTTSDSETQIQQPVPTETIGESNEAVIFCHKCGARIFEDCDFCYKCGAKIIYRGESSLPQNR